MGMKKGGLSSRNKEYWIKKGYNKSDSEKMSRSRMPGTIEYYTIFKKLSYDDALIKSEEFRKNRIHTKENMIKRYGDVEGTKRWEEYRKKQSISNTLEYKSEKYGWNKEDFIQYNKSRGLIGNKNPNYGTSYYNIWIKKYGKFIADIMNSESSIGKANGYKNRKNFIISDTSRKKMKDSAIKRVKENGCITSFNKNACKIIDEYGKKNGYNLKHAMNGGEFHVPDLPYVVDGYDIKNNVVVEYYEKYHFYQKQIHIDNLRQIEIMNKLKCKFVIISYDNKIKEYSINEN